MAERWLIHAGVSVACGLAVLAWYAFLLDLVARAYPQRLRSLWRKSGVPESRRKGNDGALRALAGIPVQTVRRIRSIFRESAIRKRVERAFPEVVDLMLVCIDAGMNLHSALRYVAHVTEGHLGDDLKRAVYAASTGRGMREALKELSGPHSTPALRFFVTTMGFSYARGNPVSEVLRAQAWMAREQRRQALEAVVRSMPTKIVVCSILFFMPAILVVTVLPSVLVFLVSRW